MKFHFSTTILQLTSAALLASRGYAQGEDESRIRGGTPAEPGAYPYFVELNGCGGTLIAPRVVLSAGHCVFLPDGTGLDYVGASVNVGAYESGQSSAEGADLVTVAAQAVHPAFGYVEGEETPFYDYMLLLLERDAELTYETDITLSLDTTDQSDGLTPADTLTIIGLGNTGPGESGSDVLLEAEVNYVDDETCFAQFEGLTFEPPVDLPSVLHCASATGSSSCPGDSGGPILLKDGNNHIQTGVVSFGGAECANPNFPTAYSEIGGGLPWIRSTVCDEWNQAASFCETGPTDPPVAVPATSLTSSLAEAGYTAMAVALEASGLAPVLAEVGVEITVFAPDNDAFDAALTAYPNLDDVALDEILAYHITGNSFSYEDLIDASKSGKIIISGVPPAGMERAGYTIDGCKESSGKGKGKGSSEEDCDAISVRGAHIAGDDIFFEGGIIQGIDAVMIPPGVNITDYA